MKTKTLLTLIFISVSILNFGQNIFESKQWKFSMEKPENWIEVESNTNTIDKNNIDTSEENIIKILNNNKGSVLLVTYYKYSPETYKNFIPTVQVEVRASVSKDFDDFIYFMTQSANLYKDYLKDFEFEVKPGIVEISGIKAFYFVGKYSTQTKNGQIIKVSNRTYAIPNGSYFFQLNFTDSKSIDESSELFENLIKSIEIK